MTNKRLGLIKKMKKSPKCAQSLGLVKFQVPSPQRVKRTTKYKIDNFIS